MLRRGATETEGKFIDAISKHLKSKAGSMNFPSIERFKRDCALYLSPPSSPPLEGKQHSSVGYKKSRIAPVEEDKEPLLTEVYSHGFDFLFPQNTHDKVRKHFLTIISLKRHY
jgi:hypothetical protein